MFAVINPARVARSAPLRNSISDRVIVTALGGLLGAATLLVFGATSGWLLGIADASRPAIRLAAGGLLLLSAGVDLATRPKDDLPSLPGSKAALVPVAVPLFIRPAMLIAGISVVADHGLVLYGAALAAALAATVIAATLAPTSDPQRLVHVWAGRLFSAVAVAGSAVLIAHAVFDL